MAGKLSSFIDAIYREPYYLKGKKVDVALDPGHEEIFCKNNEVKAIMSVNISRIKRTLRRRAKSKEDILQEKGEGLMVDEGANGY